MKGLFFLLIICFAANIYAQEKYLIYFTDKGITAGNRLEKGSRVYEQTINELSAKAIERRRKTLGGNIIDFDDVPIFFPYLNRLKKKQIKIINKLKWFNAVSAYLTPSQIADIQKFSFVKNIEKVRVFKRKKFELYKSDGVYFDNSVTGFSETDYGDSYTQLNLSEIPQVHNMGIDGGGIIIGVLDSGFRLTHRAFKNIKIIAEHDFVRGDDDTSNGGDDLPTQDSHGTYVLSIIGGYDIEKIIGAAYNAEFILAKTEDIGSETKIEEDNYAAALEWMESLGADISTSSLGYNIFDGGSGYTKDEMNGETAIVTRAVNKAFRKGMITVTSAGNEGGNSWNIILAPADAFDVIAVGSVDDAGNLAFSSSRGPTADGRIKPEICAMGVGVYGANVFTGDYFRQSGTSAAAPIVSGSAALILSAFPYLNNKQLRSIILESGDQSDSPDNNRGYGLLSTLKAVTFPNLEFDGGKYLLHKIFSDSGGINSNGAAVHFINSGETIDKEMSAEGVEFTAEVPVYNYGDSVDFYFTYSNITGGGIREPLVDNYKMYYGDLIVSRKVQAPRPAAPANNMQLYHIFPNPFCLSDEFTTIQFYSENRTEVNLSVYNILGGKINNLFSGRSEKGMNVYEWNGRNNSGGQVSSGIYIVLLEYPEGVQAQKFLFLK